MVMIVEIPEPVARYLPGDPGHRVPDRYAREHVGEHAIFSGRFHPGRSGVRACCRQEQQVPPLESRIPERYPSEVSRCSS